MREVGVERRHCFNGSHRLAGPCPAEPPPGGGDGSETLCFGRVRIKTAGNVGVAFNLSWNVPPEEPPVYGGPRRAAQYLPSR